MKLFKQSLVIGCLSLMCFSCSDDDLDDNQVLTEPVSDFFTDPFGFLVTNQGPFNEGFGTVSFTNFDFADADNGIYQEVNDDNLGNIVQSIGFNDDEAYIVANVGNRITVVNRSTFVETARITEGLENPRYMEVSNGKGYVSNWGDPFVTTDDYVAIVDLATNTITSTIAVGEGPERILVDGDTIYVALRGGFGVNNQIVVIDAITDTVSSTIAVGDVPDSMRLDDTGNLWVIAEGNPGFVGDETPGMMSRIDTATQEVAANYAFETTEHPSFLNIVGDELFYYLNAGVYRTSVSDFAIPSAPEFMTPLLSNMLVPNSDVLLGTDAGDFTSNGNLRVYDLSTGEEIATLGVGIIPSEVYVIE